MSNETITAPQGFRAGAAAAGIKVPGKLDVGVVVADAVCAGAAVFTKNRFCGCPVIVGREHVRGGRLRAFVANSGCSNVATGQRGLNDALEMCRHVAERIDAPVAQVLPFSTGLIGAFLPMDKIRRGIADALGILASTEEAGQAFARAIMTTDTRPKIACERFKAGRQVVTVAGCCKGSGMIAPNMATMLAFLTTDAGLPAATLRKLLRQAVEPTFNRVTVDECPSTSDTVAIMAGGAAARLSSSREIKSFAAALQAVCESLAYKIAADGEGATRVLEVRVAGAAAAAEAHAAARAIAVSPLVKTAVHGGDPNWGRIVQALGATKVKYQPQRVTIRIGGVVVFQKAAPAPGLDLKKLAALMRQPHVTVEVDLHAGKAADRVLTCDLSRDYVAVNADYST